MSETILALPARVHRAQETADSLGIQTSYLSALVKRGLPCNRANLGTGLPRLLFDLNESRLWLEWHRAGRNGRTRAAWDRRKATVDGQEWLRPHQAARVCGVPRTTLRKWMVIGLPFEVIDGRQLLHRRVVRGWHKYITLLRGGRRKHIIPVCRDDSIGGTIYALVDPRSEKRGQIRYIGASTKYSRRAGDYGTDFERDRAHSIPLLNWFRKLKRDPRGLRPKFRILDECLFGLFSLEQEWIAKGRRKGWRLLNITPGGQGGEWSEERKLAQSELNRQRWQEPEYQRRHEEHRAKRAGLSVEHYRLLAKYRAVVANRPKKLREPSKTRTALEERKAILLTITPLTYKGTAFVPLTQGQWARVDAEDWPRVSKHLWAAQKHRGQWRAKRSINKGIGIMLLSRFVSGAGVGEMAVFANGNTLDCRRRNLSIIKQITGQPKRQLLMA